MLLSAITIIVTSFLAFLQITDFSKKLDGNRESGTLFQALSSPALQRNFKNDILCSKYSSAEKNDFFSFFSLFDLLRVIQMKPP